MDKIRSGDVYEIADVVRNLMLRDKSRGLSAAEKKVLNTARQILFSELMLSKDLTEDDIASLVDEIISKKMGE